MMSRLDASVAVLVGQEAVQSDSGTAEALRLTGLEPQRLSRINDATVVLELLESGWQRLNLGALAAAARARPEQPVEFGPAREGPAVARAVAGTVSHLERPARWRLNWPGPPRPRVAFLDRDGTIIEDRAFLSDPDGVSLLPGAAQGLSGLVEIGMRLVVITNQSGVARGHLTLAQLDLVNARLEALLGSHGVALGGIFTCPHAPSDRCACRKPGTGLVREAKARLGIDPATGMVVGDKPSDLALGHALGLPTVLVATGEGARTLAAGAPWAHYLVEDLSELARICAHPGGMGRLSRLD